jgi:CelD/BcsL family acetyltransferase involved in cellulose biosynthesis
MLVQRIATLDDMIHSRERWNELAAGNPFRCWEWLATWWRHFRDRGQLYVLLVTNDDGALVGIAPWFIEQNAISGRVIHSLGSGIACTDYLGVSADPRFKAEVIQALASWLVEANRTDSFHAWDVLQLEGIDAGDETTKALLTQLEQLGCTMHQQPGVNCWRIPIPSTWDQYLKQLPKPQRKRMRQSRAVLDDEGPFRVTCAADTKNWDYAWSRFVELHQKRRTSLGQPGCFADAAFGIFLQDASEEFLRRGNARLTLVEKDEQAIGSLLTLTGGTTCFAYQMGTNPDCLADSPGWLLVCAAILASMERQETGLDLLRGDEPYKSRMGAIPQSTLQVRVVPAQLAAQLRHTAWLTGATLKTWIKTGLALR